MDSIFDISILGSLIFLFLYFRNLEREFEAAREILFDLERKIAEAEKEKEKEEKEKEEKEE